MNENKKINKSVRLSINSWNELSRIAVKEKRSVSNLVQKIIEDYLITRKKG